MTMKQRWKGLVSLWLAVLMVLCMMPVPVMAEVTEQGYPADCQELTKDVTTLSGNYYLNSSIDYFCSNVTVSTGASIYLGNNVTLGTYYGNGITVKENATLTIADYKNDSMRSVCPHIIVDSGGVLKIDVNKVYLYRNAGGPWVSGEGNFELMEPEINYYTKNNGETKVFDGWYAKEGLDEDESDTGKRISTDAGKTISALNSLWNSGASGDASYTAYLYRHWKDGHTVTYNYGYTGSENKTVGVVTGASITLESPTRSGYSFTGWYNESNEKMGPSITPTENITLTAQWTPYSGTSGGSSGGNSSGNNTNNDSENKKTVDWNQNLNKIENLKEGDKVAIDLNNADQTTVPGKIFNTIKGKDVTIILNMGNGISWKINGRSITADNVSDIDFGVDLDAKGIPVEVINKVSGERYTVQVSLAHNGEFGMEAILQIDLKAKNAGLYANLFYYDPDKNMMVFMGTDKITKEGMAEFTFTHASDYCIVIDKEPMNQITDKKSGAVYTITRGGTKGGTVTYTKPLDKKADTVTVPDEIKVDGITYKVTAIGAKAFKNNKKLETIVIGKNVKTIEKEAFNGCSNLTTVKKGVNVTKIAKNAFKKCTSLKKIVLHSKLEEIGDKAFVGCKNLKKITVYTTLLTGKKMGKDIFKGISKDVEITVPEEKLEKYKTLFAHRGVKKKVVVAKED